MSTPRKVLVGKPPRRVAAKEGDLFEGHDGTKWRFKHGKWRIFHAVGHVGRGRPQMPPELKKRKPSGKGQSAEAMLAKGMVHLSTWVSVAVDRQLRDWAFEEGCTVGAVVADLVEARRVGAVDGGAVVCALVNP